MNVLCTSVTTRAPEAPKMGHWSAGSMTKELMIQPSAHSAPVVLPQVRTDDMAGADRSRLGEADGEAGDSAHDGQRDSVGFEADERGADREADAEAHRGSCTPIGG